jgi:hypothetical protein
MSVHICYCELKLVHYGLEKSLCWIKINDYFSLIEAKNPTAGNTENGTAFKIHVMVANSPIY